MKTALLIGSGGREHAQAWKLSRSPQVKRLIIVPGNDGMSAEWERWAMPLGSRADFAAIARRAREEKVDLAVIGPDNPLADGIVDVFEEHGITTFGPSAAAAQIEASKAFAKSVMAAAGVPTAHYFEARSSLEAKKILEGLDWKSGWVLKADGLALGKGVHVCATLAEAQSALGALEAQGHCGHLVIEERLSGEEISWMAFCDGTRCALLEPARDYKRAYDGDQGPNTGGMGALSPVPGVSPEWAARVRNEVFLPTLREMARRGAPFRGVLYAGLMVDLQRGILNVLEFNARFGDPETQVLLSRMDADFYEWCEASARGDLSRLPSEVPFAREAAVVVVAAARGYPEAPQKGAPIEGPLFENANSSEPSYFLAGVARLGQDFIVSGGRVLGAMGRSPTLEGARTQAYARIEKIHAPGLHYRKDIASGRPS